jgi:hypothetical protein
MASYTVAGLMCGYCAHPARNEVGGVEAGGKHPIAALIAVAP